MIDKTGVAMDADDAPLDDPVLLAAGSLIAAIEGRQSQGSVASEGVGTRDMLSPGRTNRRHA